jgi:hypothetical protein
MFYGKEILSEMKKLTDEIAKLHARLDVKQSPSTLPSLPKPKSFKRRHYTKPLKTLVLNAMPKDQIIDKLAILKNLKTSGNKIHPKSLSPVLTELKHSKRIIHVDCGQYKRIA